ncbi:MAG: hypothetical protein ACREQQ_16075 [Candidatus Binatia bacterium]
MQVDGAASRDRFLTALVVMMGLMALSNFSKPITQSVSGGSAGFVFFGTRLYGTANAIVGPIFGALLAAYAYGVWTRRRWVLPLAFVYAGYVIVNLILFMWIEPPAEAPPLAGMLAYAAVAVGVSGGGAYYLARHRELLR